MTLKLSTPHSKWFHDARGIDKATLSTFGIYSDKDAICFPYPQAANVKKRAGFDTAERKFWWDIPLSSGVPPFLSPIQGGEKLCFIVEGETDTLRLWQEVNAAKPDFPFMVMGLSGLNSWNDANLVLLEGVTKVFVILDNDTAYVTRNQVDKVWHTLRAAIGTRARRIILPQGIKDVCEFFQAYSWSVFIEMMKKSSAPVWNYKQTDLSQTLNYKWLVEPLIATNDVVVMYGEPGMMKSWITMSLATAIANGESEWLEMPLANHGPILYVDEENPLDVITTRFRKLGLKDANAHLVRFLWYSGVRLDKEPQRLFEDVESLKPALVVIDSLSRVHTSNENSSEEMNAIFNRGIIPISRHLGCSVIVLHHTAKPGDVAKRSSPRGSSVIQAAPDISLEVKRGPIPSSITISPSKLRRTPKFGTSLDVVLRDTPSGVTFEKLEGENF